jgi:hypothetical protein
VNIRGAVAELRPGSENVYGKCMIDGKEESAVEKCATCGGTGTVWIRHIYGLPAGRGVPEGLQPHPCPTCRQVASSTGRRDFSASSR